jgi:hypothetical protein
MICTRPLGEKRSMPDSSAATHIARASTKYGGPRRSVSPSSSTAATANRTAALASTACHSWLVRRGVDVHADERSRRRREQDRRAAALGAHELRSGLLKRRARAVVPGQRSARAVTSGPPGSGLGRDRRARRPGGCGRLSRTRGPLAPSSWAPAGFGRSLHRRGVAETCRPRAEPPVPA